MRSSPPNDPAHESSPPAAVSPSAAGHGRQASTRRIASSELFAGAVEVEIEHQEQVYRLRRTSLGKLILTK